MQSNPTIQHMTPSKMTLELSSSLVISTNIFDALIFYWFALFWIISLKYSHKSVLLGNSIFYINKSIVKH